MQYVALFFMALLFECAYTFWNISVARGNILSASIANGLIPFLQLLSVVFLIEATTWPERFLVCGATAAGYAVGTAAVLLLCRKGDGHVEEAIKGP